MSVLRSLFDAPLVLLIVARELVVIAALLYVVVVYPKQSSKGFYSFPPRQRLWIVTKVVFFPFYFLWFALSIPWRATTKLIGFVNK
jgi:hypothetical protein